MKLIEKLAEEFCACGYCHERPRRSACEADAFEAGFRKAREMAVELAKQEGWESYEAEPDPHEQLAKLGES
jgi:hypothetical protein